MNTFRNHSVFPKFSTAGRTAVFKVISHLETDYFDFAAKFWKILTAVASTF